MGDVDLAYFVSSGSRCVYLVATAVTVRSSSSSSGVILVVPQVLAINAGDVVVVIVMQVCLTPQLWCDQYALIFRII